MVDIWHDVRDALQSSPGYVIKPAAGRFFDTICFGSLHKPFSIYFGLVAVAMTARHPSVVLLSLG